MLPWWLAHLDVDPTTRRRKFVVKGTCILADTLVEQFEVGKTDSELILAHPELTPTAMAAVREYAKVPIEMRRSFGAWAENPRSSMSTWNADRRADEREAAPFQRGTRTSDGRRGPVSPLLVVVSDRQIVLGPAAMVHRPAA